ncbi:hypothetical protein HYX10_04250 [Candidatus Woesearchaeota archaeon]|nr:hypothetical protein [Candidatus Woesearchaeota archaeon]
MSILQSKFLVRNVNAEDLTENFLVAAIVTMLAIRFFLSITGYPSLSGNGLHIAHMLWGGLLMMAAILMMLIFLSRAATKAAAILGGIGFGTFIDELGKFVTNDSNYFFQPAIAVIYLIFVLIYLLSQNISRIKLGEHEYLMNAVQDAKEAVYNDLEGHEKQRALELLQQADQKNPMVKSIRSMLHKMEPISKEPGTIAKTHRFFHNLYRQLVKQKLFTAALLTFFILHSLTALAYTSYLSFTLPSASIIRLGEMASSALSTAFVMLGLWKMRQSRIAAYKMFKRAVLVTIFLTHFFTFYQQQLTALAGFAWNIFLLIALRYMISEEENRKIAVKAE